MCIRDSIPIVFVSAQQDRVAGHHVRPVQEIGDAAETLGLALREERIVADVQAHQLGVLDGCAGGEDFQLERIKTLGQALQHQLAAIHLERGALAVDQHARQVQLFAVQPQRLGRHVRVAANHHLVENAGLCRIQVKAKVDGVDPECRRLVVGAMDHVGLAFTHLVVSLKRPASGWLR